MFQKNTIETLCLSTFLCLFISCSLFNKEKTTAKKVRLSTTSSTVGSGLFDELIPAFEKKHQIEVEVFSKGTGAALKMAREGKADVVLVHSREAEDKFVVEGFGINRIDVMHNEFVLLGPPNDPAKIAETKDILKALKKIASLKPNFVTRGDDSGTHQREKELWKLASISPDGGWYHVAKSGMKASLKLASEKNAYILSDTSTYLFNKDSLKLTPVLAGDERLFNPYGVIAVNPGKIKDVNFDGAMKFIDYLTSKEGFSLIENYGKEKFGKALFIPAPFSE